VDRIAIADTRLLLHFLRIDSKKIDLHQIAITFDANKGGIQTVELVYMDKKKRLNRCIIGINGLDRPDVITPGLVNR
jgi:hypothetical protein